jgi:hypothetical protein
VEHPLRSQDTPSDPVHNESDELGSPYEYVSEFRWTSPTDNSQASTNPTKLTVSVCKADLTEMIPNDTLLVQYDVGRDELTIWAMSHTVGKTRIWVHRSAITQREFVIHLRKMFWGLVKDCGKNRYSDLTNSSSWLSRKLLSPVAELVLQHKRLIVVPHAALHWLSFHILR